MLSHAAGKTHEESSSTHRTVYLLSPAATGGLRTAMLLNPKAQFDLAVRLRAGQATIGEVFSFLSGLYFRGKLAYARAFGEALVITAGCGLMDADEHLPVAKLRAMGLVPIGEDEARYVQPLRRDARQLARSMSGSDVAVLLGSIATGKYVEPLLAELGDRLRFPAEFAGRGDMSRGGLMLRCARTGRRMKYVNIGHAPRHGPRPPRLQ